MSQEAQSIDGKIQTSLTSGETELLLASVRRPASAKHLCSGVGFLPRDVELRGIALSTAVCTHQQLGKRW